MKIDNDDKEKRITCATRIGKQTKKETKSRKKSYNVTETQKDNKNIGDTVAVE